MKVEIIDFEECHAREIIERNIKENISSVKIDANLDKLMRAYKSEGSLSYTLRIDDSVICCGGIVNIDWHRGEAWLLASSLFKKYQKTCFKAIKRILPYLAESGKFRRIQALTYLDTNPNLLLHLKFSFDGLIPCFGPNGEDLYLLSRIFK